MFKTWKFLYLFPFLIYSSCFGKNYHSSTAILPEELGNIASIVILWNQINLPSSNIYEEQLYKLEKDVATLRCSKVFVMLAHTSYEPHYALSTSNAENTHWFLPAIQKFHLHCLISKTFQALSNPSPPTNLCSICVRATFFSTLNNVLFLMTIPVHALQPHFNIETGVFIGGGRWRTIVFWGRG